MFIKTNHLCDLMKLFGITIQLVKNKVPMSLPKQTIDGWPNTFLNCRIFFLFSRLGSDLFDIRVMKACLS